MTARTNCEEKATPTLNRAIDATLGLLARTPPLSATTALSSRAGRSGLWGPGSHHHPGQAAAERPRGESWRSMCRKCLELGGVRCRQVSAGGGTTTRGDRIPPRRTTPAERRRSRRPPLDPTCSFAEIATRLLKTRLKRVTDFASHFTRKRAHNCGRFARPRPGAGAVALRECRRAQHFDTCFELFFAHRNSFVCVEL